MPQRSLDFTKLIPIEEYVDIEHDVPYQFYIQNEKTVVRVFGVEHSNEVEHSQFKRLEKCFAKHEPHCVLLEGIQDELLFSELHKIIGKLGRDEAIARGGEAVFAAKLALESGSTWQSIEPEDKTLFEYLEKFGFKRQEIVVWFILRLLPQYIRRGETIHFAEYIEPFLDQIDRVTGWSEVDEDPALLLQDVTTVLGSSIQLHSERQALRYVSPLATTSRDHDYTVINTIAATATEYRDREMLKRIIAAADVYGSVLVVYGASHAVRQEPVLRDYFGG